MGKSTISMAIFNSFLYVYQAGYPFSEPFSLAPKLCACQQFCRPPGDIGTCRAVKNWTEPGKKMASGGSKRKIAFQEHAVLGKSCYIDLYSVI